MIGDHPPGDAEQPQAVLGRGRNDGETPPSHGEHLGDDVAGVDVVNPAPDIVGHRARWAA